MRFSLGQRVRITGTAVKHKEWSRYPNGAVTFVEGGLPTRHNYPKPKQYDEGVIVGRRTVQEGEIHNDEGYGYYFHPDVGAARNVWLVAFDMRMNPAMCFDHQVYPIWEVADDADAAVG